MSKFRWNCTEPHLTSPHHSFQSYPESCPVIFTLSLEQHQPRHSSTGTLWQEFAKLQQELQFSPLILCRGCFLSCFRVESKIKFCHATNMAGKGRNTHCFLSVPKGRYPNQRLGLWDNVCNFLINYSQQHYQAREKACKTRSFCYINSCNYFRKLLIKRQSRLSVHREGRRKMLDMLW